MRLLYDETPAHIDGAPRFLSRHTAQPPNPSCADDVDRSFSPVPPLRTGGGEGNQPTRLLRVPVLPGGSGRRPLRLVMLWAEAPRGRQRAGERYVASFPAIFFVIRSQFPSLRDRLGRLLRGRATPWGLSPPLQGRGRGVDLSASSISCLSTPGEATSVR